MILLDDLFILARLCNPDFVVQLHEQLLSSLAWLLTILFDLVPVATLQLSVIVGVTASQIRTLTIFVNQIDADIHQFPIIARPIQTVRIQEKVVPVLLCNSH